MYHNKKGFTLIEIIVSIAIASIVLMIAGTLILSSTSLLTNTTETDLEKRTVDSIIDFVRSEIEYSSDVRLVTDGSQYKPTASELSSDDWHKLYVKDNQLFRDEKAVFPASFYSNKQFEMTAQGQYQNSQRLDIKYTLQSAGEDKYSSRDTVILLNFSASDEIKEKGLYTADYKSLSQENGKDKYMIYYNKKYTAPKSSKTLTGTVADIQDNIFWGNCKGLYSSSGYSYQKGEIAFYNGFWWECLKNSINSAPDSNFEWKCLDKNYTHDVMGINKTKSGYEKNDIVVYNNTYYRMKRDGVVDNQSDLMITNSATWDEIGLVGNETTEITVKANKYARRQVYTHETVVKKYFPSSVSMKDYKRSSITEYNRTETYKVGDIVKILNPLDRNGAYYDLYIKKFDAKNAIDAISQSPSSGWIKIDTSYDGKSSYAIDDIVVIDGSYSFWVKAKIDVLDTNNPLDETWDENSYWSKL